MNVAAEAIRLRVQMHQQNLARGEAQLKQIDEAKAITERLMADDRNALEYYSQQLQVAAPQQMPQHAPPGYQLVPVVPPPGYQFVPVHPAINAIPAPKPEPPGDHPSMRPVNLGPAGSGVPAMHGQGMDFGSGIFGGVATDGTGLSAEDL